MVRNDGTTHPVKEPPNSDNTGLAGAGGGKASLSDLLRLYKSFLSTYKSEQNNSSSENGADPAPLRQVSNLFEGKIQIGDAEITKNAYALGWVRSALPQQLGTIGVNAMFMGGENMPVIGNTSPGTTVLHHHGNSIGAISSVHLIPETDTAIVVLSNTLGFADTADWVGQLILQTIIGEEPLDYKSWAQKAKTAHFKQYSDLMDELDQGKTNKPPSQRLDSYAWRYYNAIGNFVLEIFIRSDRGGLNMKVQDLQDAVYELIPYGGDTFYWPCDREEELCKEQMFPWLWAGVHKISFASSDGFVQSLSWGHDPSVADEVFSREVIAGTKHAGSQKISDHL